jgi:hypothetical protein
MRNETIEKLRSSARGERAVGNLTAAANIEARIIELERKHGGLVPVQQLDARAAVEAAWSAIAPETRVVLLCIESGLSRAVRREMPMREAVVLLRAEKARLLGLVSDTWVNVQQTTENTPPLFVPDAKKQLFI